jgi:MYXO-CTERM domain-containing protein
VLGSLKADPDQSPQLHPADPRQAWMLLLLLLLLLLLVILTFSPP